MKKRNHIADHKPHVGEAIQVGGYLIFVGGIEHLKLGFNPEVGFDVVVPLTDLWQPSEHGNYELVFDFLLPDLGGLPEDWSQRLTETFMPKLAQEKRVVVFCYAGHGRTGTLIASLIALLEPEEGDPIAATRQRYCLQAVESKAQAEGIFAVKSESLPESYAGSFKF